jgi:hypothetical protein
MILLACFALPGLAQNTKGDKPVSNERTIRQTKAKTVRRKDKARTRDIAGRRLRTKDKSSANRANVGIRQPDPYAGRRLRESDRPAKPRDRIYSEKPTEKPRVQRGDISGHRIRTDKPRTSDGGNRNVYPQYGRYVTPQAPPSRPPKYKSTASGNPVVRRVPQQQERAWKGDIKGQPISRPRSVSAERRNTFPQPNQYSRYVKRRSPGEKAVSNRNELSRTQRLSRHPKTSGHGGGYITTGNKGFVKRGRKNVYWGKFSKGERPITTDLTGRPVRTKNYRSTPPGLVGRDTLMGFGRRPRGDVSFAGRRQETPGVRTPNSGRSWQGDISGHRLRSRKPGAARVSQAGFPAYLSTSTSGQVGKPMRSAPFSQKPRREVAGKPIPPRPPGMGAKTIADYTARMRGGPTKGISPQGEGFSGFIKVKRGRRGDDVGSYSGNMLQTKSFKNQGEGFSGFTKAGRPVKGGGSVSGKLWNNKETAISGRNLPAGYAKPGTFAGNLRAQQKGYGDQGEEFTGYDKAKKSLKGGGSVSGNLWNNRNQSVTTRTLPRSADRPGRFSGNMLGSGKQYGDQGAEFTGYLKAKKPLKGGGSVSGNLWNNNNQTTTTRTLPRSADNPGKFSGSLLGSDKEYHDQGAEFTGYLKAKKQAKGGGSVSGQMWNNQGQPVTELPSSSAALVTSSFSGKSKAKESKPSTGGFDGKGKFSVKEAGKVSKGGFDSEGKFRFKEEYTQSPNAVSASTKKHKPERAGFAADGLQIRISKKHLSEREHSVAGALRGEAPKKGSIRASEFASGARSIERRHNPYASDEALKGTYYSGAAKMGSFHGNLKAKKFDNNRSFHPDSKFAHGGENNVKEERTFLTNVKLWWTKLFHDSESQPNSVREKERRPRYDKGEIGMWAE